MKLITLFVTPYKEKDGIVNAISENSLISFNVRSLFNPKSKNHPLSTPLLEIDAEFEEGNYKFKILKSSKIMTSPYSINDSLEKLGVISLMQEATKRLLNEEEQGLIYNLLKNALDGLKSGKVNVYQIAISYLYNILKLTGNELCLDGCVFCGSNKNIVGFSFVDGGYICKDCVENGFVTDIPLNLLLLFRRVCQNINFETPIPNLDNENGLFILKKICEYVYSSFGINLKSLQLL